ncbi:hypothetical protein EDD29_3951 [Actinocorallia herbida]|uniref:Uncharacterized protein n=1 Tax=Actinocorallia herbida TaxID=58109 RepID=A0A3N1CYM7_9ACTN|nr:hypothetical protein EDD29_3951 [Actinocorallia herbida]
MPDLRVGTGRTDGRPGRSSRTATARPPPAPRPREIRARVRQMDHLALEHRPREGDGTAEPRLAEPRPRAEPGLPERRRRAEPRPVSALQEVLVVLNRHRHRPAGIVLPGLGGPHRHVLERLPGRIVLRQGRLAPPEPRHVAEHRPVERRPSAEPGPAEHRGLLEHRTRESARPPTTERANSRSPENRAPVNTAGRCHQVSEKSAPPSKTAPVKSPASGRHPAKSAPASSTPASSSGGAVPAARTAAASRAVSPTRSTHGSADRSRAQIGPRGGSERIVAVAA